VGLWIQKTAPWDLGRLVLGPRTPDTADIAERAREAVDRVFDRPPPAMP
jgi:hypothetical protein